jgi:hypothetical protein
MLRRKRESDMTKTRKSTPKYEVYHTDGLVILSGISHTEATNFARQMDEGSKKKRFAVRPVERQAAA